MTISTDDVRHVARLARLAMHDDDLQRFTGELDKIMHHIGKVAELDLAGVEPTTHVIDVAGGMADDEPHESLAVAQALQNAPDGVEGMFRVPRMRS